MPPLEFMSSCFIILVSVCAWMMASQNGPVSEGDSPTALQLAEQSPMALRQYGVCLAMNVLKNAMKILDGGHESCAEAGLTSTEEKDRCGVAWPFGLGKSPVESRHNEDVATVRHNSRIEIKYQGMRLSGLAAVERLLDEFRLICENMMANSDSHSVISRGTIANIFLSKKSYRWSNRNRTVKVNGVHLSREIAMEACKKTLQEMVDVLCTRVIFIIKEALVPCISDKNFRKNIKVARAVDEGCKMRIQTMLQSFMCQQLDSLQVILEEGLVRRLTEFGDVSLSTDINLTSLWNLQKAKGGASVSSESACMVCIPAGHGLEKRRQVLNDDDVFRLHPSASDEDNGPKADEDPRSDGPISRKPLLPVSQMSVPETPSPDGAGEAAFGVMQFSLHLKSTKTKRKSTGIKNIRTRIRHSAEHTDLKSSGLGDLPLEEEEDIDKLASQVGLLYASMMASFSTHIRSAVVPLLLQILDATDLGTKLCLFICTFSDKDIVQAGMTKEKT